ncbi:MAG: protein kinase [Planctomycetes bacterium]|nr:protein kinase [Planctomycetota bacterium]
MSSPPHPDPADDCAAAVAGCPTDLLHTPPPVPALLDVTERLRAGPAADGPGDSGHERRSGSRPGSVDPFPPVGSHLLHFELVEELGRGAFARVYLARQESLANRLVVVKVTTAHTDEPQTLARLRHTNVIPVYSVHDAAAFQVICMPYLGQTTLARALMALPDEPPAGARTLIAHARTAGHELDRLGYADGCLWVIGQLAAGLEHAHQTGTLHRDLKPANVLLTDDGTPMILDFNVASPAGAPPNVGSSVGGTFPYMAPEHLRAFAGETATVDVRSDLFSLGVMLYQMLTLELPFPLFTLPSRLETVRRQIALRYLPHEPVRAANPAVSHSVAAIVAKLLDPAPACRYQTAGELCEDVARHLANRPLRFASCPSARARAAKWRRRNPRLATALAVAAAALLLLVLPATVIAVRQSQLAARAKEVRRAEAIVAADDAVAQLRLASAELGSRVDPAARARGLASARAVVDRYAVADDPAWESHPAVAALDPSRRAALRSALAEALVLMTRAEAQAGGFSREGVEAGMRWSVAARRLFPDDARPAVLDRLRAELEARRDRRPVPPVPVPHAESDTDLHFDGIDLAAADRHREALPLLVRFCDRHPDHFQAWFARGVCHDALGQHADAAACFSVCLAVIPDFPLAVANRGIARLKQKRFPEAEADFTRALELKPGWTVALVNRGLARDGRRRWKEAEADYTAALAGCDAPTRVYFLRAKVRRADGNAGGADADFAEGLAREPNDPISWVSRGNQRLAKEPEKALADFDAALRLAPDMREALLDKGVVLADHLRRERDAIPVLDRLLELYPDHVEGRAGRGVYLARLGRAGAARRDAAAVLAAEPTAYRKYQMAGLYAQLARHDPRGPDRAEALRLLALALRAGFEDMALLKKDTDLDPIRDDPEFKRLLAAVEQVAPAR